jgi:two-component system, NarL family, response regulator NreC
MAQETSGHHPHLPSRHLIDGDLTPHAGVATTGWETARDVVPIRVIVAERYELVRQGLRLLLGADNAIAIVGEAGDGLEALEKARRLRPDVLVVDLSLPHLGGLEVTLEATRHAAPTRVLVLSVHDDEARVRQAFLNGASGFVLKACGVSDLLAGIHEVAAGNRYVSVPLFRTIAGLRLDRPSRDAADPHDRLTLREREVLQMVLEGLSNVAIARRLGISRRTAETHCAHLMAKIGLHRRADLIHYALRRGLLPEE